MSLFAKHVSCQKSTTSQDVGNSCCAAAAEPLEPRRLLSGTIAGETFIDANGDGVHDAAEAGMAGARVYIDADGDIAFDADERSALADVQGGFEFADLSPGRYSVRQVLPGVGWQQTAPAPGQAVDVELGADEQRLDLSFGARQLAQSELKSVTGTVFHDEDLDGVRDAAEGPYPASPFLYVDENNNGLNEGWEPYARVRSDGGYTLAGLAPGRYRLRIRPEYRGARPVRPSTFGPDESVVVDVPVGSSPTLDVGAYIPNVRVGDAWTETHAFPVRVVLKLFDVFDLLATKGAVRITGPGGAAVTPSVVNMEAPTSHVDGPELPFTLTVDFFQPPPQGRYTLTIPGAALKGSSGLATPADFTFAFDYPPPPSTVVARHVFYNGSRYDSPRTPNLYDAGDPMNDRAIAPDKHVLLPGEAGGFANVTTQAAGITGLMIDIAGMSRGATLMPGDVSVRAGRGGDPSAWGPAMQPSEFAVRPAAGVGGSDRVVLIGFGNAPTNTWLEVTVNPSRRTGLASPDVFYIGNLVGETGGAVVGTLRVDAADLAAVRRNFGPAGIDSPFDFNRDGVVSSADLALARANQGRTLSFPTPPPAAITNAPVSAAAVTRPLRPAVTPARRSAQHLSSLLE